jgi:adsorption protein B
VAHLDQHLVSGIDHVLAVILIPLAVWALLSGADDLLLDLVCFYHWVRRGGKAPLPSEEELCSKPETPIAILVPLWHEHRVISKMIEHNSAAIKYGNHHFFVGSYVNDEPTMAVVRDLEKRFTNVHLAIVPHDGPTSKADCLNSIYDHMLSFERKNGITFPLVMTHDAEDLIHPDSLRWINYYSSTYDMVQTPVLPLPRPFRKLTHGVYCDEFSESHTRDMRARQYTGSFIPSCGVGTAFSRTSLERLALTKGNRIFEPACLTEDYENGLSLYLMGATQIFIPLNLRNGSFVATREYFPQTFGAAVKQRTRWVMGIALQGWERHGWQGGLIDKYWFWRDRKGLIGNTLGLVTNLISLYGLVTWAAARLGGVAWGLGQGSFPAHSEWLFASTLSLGVLQLSVRMFCTGRIYGWVFALGVPVRAVCANCLNSTATISALYRYALGRLKNRQHAWLKTEHAYPTQSALNQHQITLEQVLLRQGVMNESLLAEAILTKPENTRLGWHLVKLGYITEAQLYQAVGQQQSLSIARVAPAQVKPNVARALPWEVVRDWRVLPFKVELGSLFVAVPELPTDELQRDLKKYTSLEIRFQLVTPANFAELTTSLL